jgi:hypothetical protein
MKSLKILMTSLIIVFFLSCEKNQEENKSLCENDCNCEGDIICEFGGIDGKNTCLDFDTEATDSTMLFDNVQH